MSAGRWRRRQPFRCSSGLKADGAGSQEDEGSEASNAGGTPERSSQATKLVALARQGDTDLFHDGTRRSYITFTSGTHRETWPLSGTSLRDWLSARLLHHVRHGAGISGAERCANCAGRHRPLRR